MTIRKGNRQKSYDKKDGKGRKLYYETKRVKVGNL
jgi:hypothetical protein